MTSWRGGRSGRPSGSGEYILFMVVALLSPILFPPLAAGMGFLGVLIPLLSSRCDAAMRWTGELDIGEMVLHHTADAYSISMEPFGSVGWQKWPDVHLGSLTLNLTPTKHVVFMVLAAVLVFLSMRAAGRSLQRQRAGQQAPKGFAAAMEGAGALGPERHRHRQHRA